ncbi:MAG TPA: SusC/RagA family TonB-linked outer membrane protein [Gemmatimonadaceae bacterium]
MRLPQPESRFSHPSVTALLRRAALALLGVLATQEIAFAQTGTGSITGRATDATSGVPMAGVSVRVAGTQLGAQTGDDGRYTIRGVSPGSVSLQANRIGYEAKKATVTVEAGQTATADLTLTQAAFSLSEVVVTVTGAQKKAEISNTVASVDIAAKASETTAQSLGQLLSGQAAGVQILSSGAAGGGSKIRIRGASSLSMGNAPVVYVDGIKVNSEAQTGNNTRSSRFDDINPEEIETIDILKGPAAATLYGTEAANGVINITTKKGKAGVTRWSVFGENMISKDGNAGNYRDLWVSFQKNGSAPLSKCLLTQVALGACHIDTTYRGNVLNQAGLTPLVTGRGRKVGAQVSGGAERLQYFVSGEYNHELGPYKMPQAEISRLEKERGAPVPYNQIYPNADARTNLRANLSMQLGSKADFNVTTGYLARANRNPSNEDSSVGLMVDALGGEARTDLWERRSPTDSVALKGYRSYPMGDVLARERNENINRFTQGFNARYYPFPWLNARANLGFDYTLLNVKNIVRRDQGPFPETSRLGAIDDTRTENSQYTADLGATGTFNPLNSITSKSSVGLQYYRTYNDRSGSSGTVYTPGVTQVSAGGTQQASSGTDLTITMGSYAEQVFSYRDRLYLTGRVRYDGNSSFGKSFKGVMYPGVGLSWLASDESFFPRLSWMNSFRLRATYGASGVQPTTTAAARYLESVIGTVAQGNDQPGVQLGALGNPNLRPEYSGEFETGFDASFLDSRSTFEFTYYNKKTKDAIIERRIAPSIAGITSIFDNLGSIRNQGMEATFNNRFIDNNNIGFDVQLTGSTNKNRILSLGAGVTPLFTGNRNTQYNAPGYPLFGLWGKHITFEDKNKDGYLAVNEVCQAVDPVTKFGCRAVDTAIYVGPTAPTIEFAVNPRLELLKRKLSISAQFDHKQGNLKFNNTLRHQCQGGQSCEGFWNPEASLEFQARAIAVNNYSVYTGMYENGRFTRLREVAVSYQLPDKLANGMRASRATFVVAGRNLHVWTPYTGVDPESTVGNGDARGSEEYFGTPPLRYVTFRLNLNF